ncbi:Verru_Chthon cassette protein C [Prosthecobacter sp.]|jgi:uncharacterized protein (TIGR02599 family)|uniref:Verru_Chthon cassette protein C n=1 Tax=Prosthecobacter sp. TaxID=1965333 RepID=UPI003784CE28
MRPSERHPTESAAFTLLELLVSMTITALLMVLLAQMLRSTQRVWSNARSSTAAFRETRTAFESMTRQLAMASLNSYWDYDNAADPELYQRQSELHFVCGPAHDLLGTERPVCGHAVFFQAPLGITHDMPGSPGASLDDRLNAFGYYITYDSDTSARPTFLGGQHAAHTPRKCFRLMEVCLPAEQMDLYQLVPVIDKSVTPPVTLMKPRLGEQTQAADLYAWFRSRLDTHSHALADHVLALIIQAQPPPSMPPTPPAEDYTYDTRGHQLLPKNKPLNPRLAQTRHQLPPTIRVTLVALDEQTWGKLSDGLADQYARELLTLVGQNLFKSPANLEKDLQMLAEEMRKRRLVHRVFNTVIPIRSAQWFTSREGASPP